MSKLADSKPDKLLIVFCKHILQKLFFFAVLFLPAHLVSSQCSLQQFIDIAKQNSPLLKELNNQLVLTRLDSMEWKAGLKPRIDLNSNNYWAPVYKGYGYDDVITDRGNFGAVIGMNKVLTGRSNIQNRYQAFALQNQRSIVEGKISAQDLAKAVTDQYISAYGCLEQYQLNLDVFKIYTSGDEILRKLTETAVYKQTDYLMFYTTMKQQDLLVERLRYQYQCSLNALRYLCGIEDTSYTELSVPELILSASPSVRNTVFYEKFMIDSSFIQNEHNRIDITYHPKVSLFADAGYLSSFISPSPKHAGAGIGINLSIPIYDGNSRELEHKKLLVQQETNREYFSFFQKQYNQQVVQLQQQLQHVILLETGAEEQLKPVEILIEADKRLLTTGDIRIGDYLMVLSNYIAARNNLLENQLMKCQLINQINYWNTTK